MSGSQSKQDVPKAILYTWPASVWSNVPLLCLHEKGYGEDEYIVKHVDLSKGENFSPSYLKINKNGTVPTLVVPTAETTSADVDSRYRSLRDTITICDFLDQARSANTVNTTSSRPAPTLSPATIEGKAIVDEIIALVHLPSVDPNFLAMSARDETELKQKAESASGAMVRDRRASLDKYIKEAKEGASHGGSFETSIVKFLEERFAANEMIYKVYTGGSNPEDLKMFYEASAKIWNTGIPDCLDRLEGLIQDDGPFTMGDQVSLADLHVISWLSRVVALAANSKPALEIDALEKVLGGRKIGNKVRGFWTAWLSRESFKKTIGQNSALP
ncbi:hypothetical protein BD324DRAFT_623016 [Kockovaella imperatae]|uniref:GST N-terminal domain-containing protein n=1 Tax=Kockovaella imperatae TaxID=4999 RepID=A0A1Y1UKR3_9TREE|nr:hypothetical protein BD324DRAFT_623016 [Kockovaella imperatae]ORX37725.1 hypothetical protein BD324DRAFT_623016 [Kockovaella imperatae]